MYCNPSVGVQTHRVSPKTTSREPRLKTEPEDGDICSDRSLLLVLCVISIETLLFEKSSAALLSIKQVKKPETRRSQRCSGAGPVKTHSGKVM